MKDSQWFVIPWLQHMSPSPASAVPISAGHNQMLYSSPAWGSWAVSDSETASRNTPQSRGFAKTWRAPAANALACTDSSKFPVRMITGKSRCSRLFFSCIRQSIPSRTGIWLSRMTRSAWWCSSHASAKAPFSTSSHSYPLNSRMLRSACLTSGSSSAIRILFIRFLVCWGAEAFSMTMTDMMDFT